MDSIKKLYEDLWKSFIRPRRYWYSECDLGSSFVAFDNCSATRLDFKLSNPLHESFNLSVFLPTDAKGQVLSCKNFIVYAHTHNGSRIEGLGILEPVLEKGMGLAVFDFRANGFSSGKYVTLGWLEALDLNEVVKFLQKEFDTRSISLWGRSMGGTAISLFMSQKFRDEISAFLKAHKLPESSNKDGQKPDDKIENIHNRLVHNADGGQHRALQPPDPLAKTKSEGQEASSKHPLNKSIQPTRPVEVVWAKMDSITSLILDSCFPNLKDAIHHLVCNKVTKVPKFCIEAVFGLISKEIKEKASIDIHRINPIDYVDCISIPTFMYVGDKDELISTEMFQNFYARFGAAVRRLKIFPGQHAQERPASLVAESLEFIQHIRQLKKEKVPELNQDTTISSGKNQKLNKTGTKLKIYDQPVGLAKTNLRHANSLQVPQKPQVVKPSFFGFQEMQTSLQVEQTNAFGRYFDAPDEPSQLNFDANFIRTEARNHNLTIGNINEITQLKNNETKDKQTNLFSLQVPVKSVFGTRSSVAIISNAKKIEEFKNTFEPPNEVPLEPGANFVIETKRPMVPGNFIKKPTHDAHHFSVEHHQQQNKAPARLPEFKTPDHVISHKEVGSKTLYVPVYETKGPVVKVSPADLTPPQNQGNEPKQLPTFPPPQNQGNDPKQLPAFPPPAQLKLPSFDGQKTGIKPSPENLNSQNSSNGQEPTLERRASLKTNGMAVVLPTPQDNLARTPSVTFIDATPKPTAFNSNGIIKK